MIVALLIGREGSTGYPGKNTALVLGKPLATYPLHAAVSAPSVNYIFMSTDSPALKHLAQQYRAQVIDRPAHLCTDAALGEDVVLHGYRYLTETLGLPVKYLVLLLCNSPTITGHTIETGIAALDADETLDSAITVSRYNMWSPLRARKIVDGLLQPFVPFETFGDPAMLSCDRDSQGDVWFADMGMSIMRPRCFVQMEYGLLPQRWMGQRIAPIKQEAGLDIDYAWQVPQAEWWLEAHGF